MFPPKALGKNTPCTLLAPGRCQQSLAFMACGSITPCSGSTFKWPPVLRLFCVLKSLTECRAHPNPIWPHLNCVTLEQALFPNKATFTGNEVSPPFWEDSSQPTTMSKTWRPGFESESWSFGNHVSHEGQRCKWLKTQPVYRLQQEKRWYFSHYCNLPYQSETSIATNEGSGRGPWGLRKSPQEDEGPKYICMNWELAETLAAWKYTKGTERACALSLTLSFPSSGTEGLDLVNTPMLYLWLAAK